MPNKTTGQGARRRKTDKLKAKKKECQAEQEAARKANAMAEAKTQAVATPNISSAALPFPNPTLTISAEYPMTSYEEDAIISPTSGNSSHGHFHLKDFHTDLNSLNDEIGDISENELNKVVTDDDSDGYIGDLGGPQGPPNASPLHRSEFDC